MMETPKVFESEYKFCLILWENEPIKSGNLGKTLQRKIRLEKVQQRIR